MPNKKGRELIDQERAKRIRWMAREVEAGERVESRRVMEIGVASRLHPYGNDESTLLSLRRRGLSAAEPHKRQRARCGGRSRRQTQRSTGGRREAIVVSLVQIGRLLREHHMAFGAAIAEAPLLTVLDVEGQILFEERAFSELGAREAGMRSLSRDQPLHGGANHVASHR